MDSEPRPNFVADVLSYPFRKGGFNMLVVGTILFVISSLVSYSPFLGGTASLFVFAYLCGLYFELVELSSDEDNELFAFPDISDPIEDIVLPTVKVIGVIIISFLPLIGWIIWGDDSLPFYNETIYALVAWGTFYIPMAMLATITLGSLRGAMIHIVLPSIFKAGPLYLLAAFMLGAIYTAEAFAFGYLDQRPFVTIPAAAFIAMYALMANARTLGLLLQRREEELGWY